MTKSIKVFDYIEELDAFICTDDYVDIVGHLGLIEWTPCVWICRLLIQDNDFGEHLFDNWDEREALEEKAKALGYDDSELLIVVPDRYQNGKDGPCHSAEQRKRFWTDVYKSLHLSLDTIFEEARNSYVDTYNLRSRIKTEYYTIRGIKSLDDLENKINKLRNKYN